MNNSINNYKPILGLQETEKAIKFIKDHFQVRLAKALNLTRVSAPLFVSKSSGINDYLSGTEKPVGFFAKDAGENAEIVQSLAKWKRAALKDYGFKDGQGLYTDMNAIRPDEKLDNLHSLYVDQWDWERIIHKNDRHVHYLKKVVKKIYAVIRETERAVCKRYKGLGKPSLSKDIFFIHSEELEERYPNLNSKGRETAICKERGAVFVIGIGAALKNGKPHDLRAPDYDDWWTKDKDDYPGLNGDILVWNPALKCAYELSSMGIRVDKRSLLTQLRIERIKTKSPYHKRLLKGELPLTMGGGIGQSRLCMFFLRKAHIGEVQSSLWPKNMVSNCLKNNIKLL
jgi:aspartate--ammonia ligase